MGRSRCGIAHLTAIQGIILDFFEGICQIVGIATNHGTIMVGFILTGAGNRHLNQAGSQWRKKDHQEGSNRIAAFVIITAAAEEGKELCRIGDDRSHHGRNRARQDIAILHMGQFMSQYAGQLVIVQGPHNPRRYRYRRMGRITAGRKGIWRVLVDDVNTRHGKLCVSGQIFHQAIELRGFLPADFAGVIHLEDHGVTKPVGKEIHAQRNHEHNHHAALAAHKTANENHNGTQQHHQH